MFTIVKLFTMQNFTKSKLISFLYRKKTDKIFLNKGATELDEKTVGMRSNLAKMMLTYKYF